MSILDPQLLVPLVGALEPLVCGDPARGSRDLKEAGHWQHIVSGCFLTSSLFPCPSRSKDRTMPLAATLSA